MKVGKKYKVGGTTCRVVVETDTYWELEVTTAPAGVVAFRARDAKSNEQGTIVRVPKPTTAEDLESTEAKIKRWANAK